MHKEIDFENAIEHALIESGGYEKVDPSTYDPETALFPGETIAFVQKTQPKIWERLTRLDAGKASAMLLDSLVKELAAKGALAVLRGGLQMRRENGAPRLLRAQHRAGPFGHRALRR